MLKIANDLLISTGSGSPLLLVTLDLSTAFDCVNHTKLLDLLHQEFSVTGVALDLLSSYLCGHYQYVKVDSAAASVTLCEDGVPQGSILGLLLFSAYICGTGL